MKLSTNRGRHLFSKIIVWASLSICIIAGIVSFYAKIKYQIDTSSELQIIVTFFGSELVALALKATFGRKKDV